MKQKLIITLWKAQLTTPLPSTSIYCLLTYNTSSKPSKNLQSKTSLQWKQTFVFPLAKQQLSLRIDFIPLKQGEEIHFAHDNLAETLSVAKATMKVPVKAATKGSLPAKLDILDEESGQVLGKVFVEYEVLKTEVAYLVEKMIDYNYILKLSSFKVTFLRQLKRTPTFYLKLKYGEKTHKQDFPFQQENGHFLYTYPIKLYMTKEIDLGIELEVREFFGLDYKSEQESMKSGSIVTDRSRDNMSTLMGKKKDTLIDVGVDSRISGNMELTFKQNTKTTKRLPLTIMIKNQPRDIGSIEFQVQALFKTSEQKQAFEQQKRGITLKQNPQSTYTTRRPKPPSTTPSLQQSNGQIILNTIMGKLQLSEQTSHKIADKNISLTLKLGKQSEESSILQNPGRELIFLDTFTFKRTWEETIKFVVDVHEANGVKVPVFSATVNLRELFEVGRIHDKKVKIFDQQKGCCGVFVLDMEYKEDDKKVKDKSNSKEKKQPHEVVLEKRLSEKRDKIAERMKQREEDKKHKVERSGSITLNKDRDIVTMAQALDLKDLILPPLKSRNKVHSQIAKQSRYSTLSPSHSSTKQQKFRSANIYNSNGGIKFPRSPRFDQNLQNNKSGSSFTLVRESDFDVKRKRGAYIGYGDKHDFTKEIRANPGIGKYVIPSLWDKYQ